jgi:hypothetical protein
MMFEVNEPASISWGGIEFQEVGASAPTKSIAESGVLTPEVSGAKAPDQAELECPS